MFNFVLFKRGKSGTWPHFQDLFCMTDAYAWFGFEAKTFPQTILIKRKRFLKLDKYLCFKARVLFKHFGFKERPSLSRDFWFVATLLFKQFGLKARFFPANIFVSKQDFHSDLLVSKQDFCSNFIAKSFVSTFWFHCKTFPQFITFAVYEQRSFDENNMFSNFVAKSFV